jgi:nitroreductase
LNAQPWQFLVITHPEVRAQIHAEAERCRLWAREESGWKWLDKYRVDFLETVPVLILVAGEPRKTGVDALFAEGGSTAYQHACAAAIQNMHLAAHALGLGSLWFTLFDKNMMRDILDLGPVLTPIGLVCVGKPAQAPLESPRKAAGEKTVYIR